MPSGSKYHFLLLLAVFGLFGCEDTDRYEIYPDAQGQLVRLNKKTGEVMRIERHKMVEVEIPTPPDELSLASRIVFSKDPTIWKDQTIWSDLELPSLGGVTAKLRTRWRDDRLFYHCSLAPVTDVLGDLMESTPLAIKGFTILLLDEYSFKVGEIDVPLNSLTPRVDDTGEAVDLHASDSTLFREDDYMAMRRWSLTWDR